MFMRNPVPQRRIISAVLVLIVMNLSMSLFADNIDGQMILSNKISFAQESWRSSLDYQIRLEDNLRSLDVHLLEGVATYMPDRNWEIVPDFRISIFPDRFEFRPGLGVIYKFVWGEKIYINQIVNQVKWQADITGLGVFKHAVRYGLFYNTVLSKKLIFNTGAAVLYRWSENYTGIQFIRMIAGISYIFDSLLSVNFSPYFGIENPISEVSYLAGLMVIFSIQTRDGAKYLPARYVSF